MDLNDLKYYKTINGLTSGKTCFDSIKSEMINDYEYTKKDVLTRFALLVDTSDGKDIFVNFSESSVRGVIDKKKTFTASSKAEELIQTYPHNIKSGDYVTFKMTNEDELANYLITSEIEQKNGYEQGVILKCNQILKWKDEKGIHEIPCVMSNDAYGVKMNENNDYISELDTKAKVLIQNNDETINLVSNMRFIFSHSKSDVYSVIQANKSIREGIITLTLTSDIYRPNDDDLENNLAYNKSEDLDNKPSEPIPTEYEIIGEKSFKQNTESVFTLSPNNSNCVWYIDDFDTENIATIVSQDNTNCTVKALSSYDDEFFTLYAKDGDTILVQKEITTTRK